MEFSFAVTDAAGHIVKQGTRSLSNMDFQLNSGRVGSDQPFFHDKNLLEDLWASGKAPWKVW